MSRTLPRGRRAVAATLVSLVVIALAVLGAVAAVQIFTGRQSTALGHVDVITGALHRNHWNDVGPLVAGIVCAAIGVIVLLAGLLPARRSLLRLADPDPHTIAGVTRRGLAADVKAAVVDLDGVSDAKVTLGRRRVLVRARTPFSERDGLTEVVHDTARRRVDAVAPARPLRVRARLRGIPDARRED